MWKAYAVGRIFGARLRWPVLLRAFRLASVLMVEVKRPVGDLLAGSTNNNRLFRALPRGRGADLAMGLVDPPLVASLQGGVAGDESARLEDADLVSQNMHLQDPSAGC